MGGRRLDTISTSHERRWYILLTVGIATFLSSLNNSIVNTILPVIERDLHIPLGQSVWIVLLYLLVLSVLLIPLGRLSDLVGRRRIFLTGFTVFVAASLACGLAHTYLLLLVGRALLAIAGAMLLSVGPALLTTTFPGNQRGRALGLQALMTYLGLALGPLIGGLLTDWFGWHSVFYSAVPVGLVGLGLGLWAIPKSSPEAVTKLDWPGTASFIIAMASIVFLMNSSAFTEHGPSFFIVLGVIFAASTIAFLIQQRRSPQPLIDLSLFGIRNFGFGTLGAIVNYLCFFLALFLLPFYLSNVLHLSPSATGLWLTLMPVMMMLSAPPAGAWSDKYGSRMLSTIGMALSGAGLAMFGLMAATNHHTLATILLALGLIFSGLGTGMFAAPNNAAILKAAPRTKQGMASGTLATARYIGMMGGITIGGSLFATLLTHFQRSGPLGSPRTYSPVTAAQPGATAPATAHVTVLMSGHAAFLHALSLVMWIGVGFAILGVLCTLSMQTRADDLHGRV